MILAATKDKGKGKGRQMDSSAESSSEESSSEESSSEGSSSEEEDKVSEHADENMEAELFEGNRDGEYVEDIESDGGGRPHSKEGRGPLNLKAPHMHSNIPTVRRILADAEQPCESFQLKLAYMYAKYDAAPPKSSADEYWNDELAGTSEEKERKYRNHGNQRYDEGEKNNGNHTIKQEANCCTSRRC
jgi:hypothetical protein